MADFRTAAFRTQPFEIGSIGGYLHTFPVLTALEWLTVFGASNWITETVAQLSPDAHGHFLDEVEDGLTAMEVCTWARARLSESAGRPWWEAERLIRACFNDGGRLLGTLLGNGTDPSRMTLAVFLACVWATLTKGADAEGLLKLEAALLVPPPEATEEERAGLDDDDMSGMVDRLRAMPGVRTG